MTDKTPQNKAENLVNIPAALAKTPDTTCDSEQKSRALPQADALKERFKAGSIPLPTDFADLIDIANIGRQAVGRDEGQTGTANGFILSSTGLLEFKTGDGIQINTRGVSIKLASNSGLSVDEAYGLTIVPEQMFHKGMVMMFAGAEAAIPNGWALCDGRNNTPNLIDRFILGSAPIDSNKFNNEPLVSAEESKVLYKETFESEVKGSINIESTALSIEQIPEHNHYSGTSIYYEEGFPNKYGFRAIQDDLKKLYNPNPVYKYNEVTSYYPFTSTTGQGDGHTHKGVFKSIDHKHLIDATPPYYTLAFIIKL